MCYHIEFAINKQETLKVNAYPEIDKIKEFIYNQI